MILSTPELESLIHRGVVTRPTRDGSVVIDLVSIGLHLDNQFTTYCEDPGQPVSPPNSLQTETKYVRSDEFYILPPNGTVLACSQEYVRMPLEFMGLVQTKGSIARGFIGVHLCDGQIDPGYEGKITLELFNLSRYHYRLHAGLAIAQLFVMEISTVLVNGYNGRYQAAVSPTVMKSSVGALELQ